MGWSTQVLFKKRPDPVTFYEAINIEYDKFDYESDYLFSKKTDDFLKMLEKSGKLFTDEENRKVLDQEGFNLSMKNPVLVLTRADGTSL